MIPKILWQTYKTKFPPKVSENCIKSWLNNNPGYEWYYFDDERCERFISDHFTQEFVDMYKSLPYGVMKSDAWRIAILYVYGGIYADLDTICIVPADEWIKDYSFVASVETTNGTIGNFTFASEPKHPIVYSCLEQLLINYKSDNYLDKLYKTGTPIQNYGAHAFHVGITNYCKSNDLTGIKIYQFDDNAFTPSPSDKTFVHHLTGSVFWHEYDSWKQQQQRDFGTPI